MITERDLARSVKHHQVQTLLHLCGREELVQADWQSVELVIARVVTKMPELPRPEHTPVPLGNMSGQCDVQHCRHNECHDHLSAEEDIEDVVEPAAIGMHRTMSSP